LYSHDTWSLAIRKEYELRVFRNKVLKSIFIPKRNKITERLRKLLDEELHNLCYSANIVTIFKTTKMRLVEYTG
jgi:hypothetical protein